MTTAAWVMLTVTWTVILFFTAKFFWKVLTTPLDPDRDAQAHDGILEKDA